MSVPNLATQRQIQALQETIERLRKADAGMIYLPWSQRVLNPFPFASSGASWGDLTQPWAVQLLSFAVSVFVVGTNNGSNYWTISLVDASAGVITSITTAAISANTATRISTASFVQPAAANPSIGIVLTATGTPGAIYLWPALGLLRTGN